MLQKLRNGYQHTVYACFIGYMVQAVVNNLAPLLFVTLSVQYSVSVEQISVLISVNFGLQLVVDLLSPMFVDRIGYKASAVLAHLFAASGLLLLAVLPGCMERPFLGLLAAVAVYAIGGGLLEVLISPIVEACPTKRKEAAMSLLHSFYCWGHAAVILLSTLFFVTAGVESWPMLAVLWAVLPIFNLLYFLIVPVPELQTEEAAVGGGAAGLLKNRFFWLMMLLMVCAGASEQGISQWASAFAEMGLGVSKTAGDLAGPLIFALLMGSARALYAKLSERLRLEDYMLFCGGLCTAGYLVASLSGHPAVSLAGCGICGFAVGVLWPGTFSLASKHLKGGTLMFALFALGGDLGCAGGPGLVGWTADLTGGGLKSGILAAAVFPAALILVLLLIKNEKRRL